MIKGTTKRVHQQSKYRQIWDIGIMFDHIRDGRPSEELDGSRLMGRTAFLLMGLVPLKTYLDTQIGSVQGKEKHCGELRLCPHEG
jgi:hypothetical protein